MATMAQRVFFNARFLSSSCGSLCGPRLRRSYTADSLPMPLRGHALVTVCGRSSLIGSSSDQAMFRPSSDRTRRRSLLRGRTSALADARVSGDGHRVARRRSGPCRTDGHGICRRDTLRSLSSTGWCRPSTRLHHPPQHPATGNHPSYHSSSGAGSAPAASSRSAHSSRGAMP